MRGLTGAKLVFYLLFRPLFGTVYAAVLFQAGCVDMPVVCHRFIMGPGACDPTIG